MTDVARRAGTSTAVVSYVFNDGPRGVSDDARRRVLAAAEELGYRPNRLARALRASRTGFVGVISPDASIPYFAELDRALVAEIGARGSTALISHPGAAGQSDEAALRSLLEAQIDGLVMVAWEGRRLDLDLTAIEVPIVFVHHRPEDAGGPFIASDDEHAVAEAVRHLREVHGFADHEIGFWTGPDDAGPAGRRTQAWRELVGGGREPDRSGYSRIEARDAFLAGGIDPVERAVIVATDEQAYGILAGAAERGIRIPEDLAVISLDGTPGAECAVPSLTVVEQPVLRMAHLAVAAVMDRTEPADVPPGTLVTRRSCGCVRAGLAAAG